MTEQEIAGLASEAEDGWPAGLRCPAPIEAVVVMEDRAQLTRRARLRLEPGRHCVVSAPVSALVADRTLRCRLREPGGARALASVRLLDLRVQRRYLARAARPGREREIHDALERLADEFLAVHDRQAVLFHERTLLQGLSDARAQDVRDGLLSGPFDPAWPQEFEQLWSRLVELEGELLSAQWEQDERRERLARLYGELRAAMQAVADYQAALVAEVEVSAPCEVELAWQYQVPCALWRPVYTAMLNPVERGDELHWHSAGMVWQRSGEDWEGVELSFSTERPSLGAELPLLADDELSTRDKTDQERKTIEVTSRDEVIARSGEGGAERQHDTPPGLEDGGEVRCYRVPGKVSVPGDGRPHRLEFEQWRTIAECQYLCIPERADFVFLRSLQTNPSRLPLLAGPVHLSRGGGFVGRSRVGYLASGERFALSWGSEDGLVVQRRLERTFEETAIRRRRMHQFEIQDVLVNHTGLVQRLRLVERLPLSEIEAVAVDLDTEQTSPGFSRDDQGQLSWELRLEAGAQQEIRLVFQVEMPHNVTWNG